MKILDLRLEFLVDHGTDEIVETEIVLFFFWGGAGVFGDFAGSMTYKEGGGLVETVRICCVNLVLILC